eukprot:7892876-Lingulodinium_polyedra.AAC.1
MGRRVLCLQEVSSWPGDLEVTGWVTVHAQGCPSAVLIPDELAGQIRWVHSSGNTSAAVIGELG